MTKDWLVGRELSYRFGLGPWKLATYEHTHTPISFNEWDIIELPPHPNPQLLQPLLNNLLAVDIPKPHVPLEFLPKTIPRKQHHPRRSLQTLTQRHSIHPLPLPLKPNKSGSPSNRLNPRTILIMLNNEPLQQRKIPLRKRNIPPQQRMNRIGTQRKRGNTLIQLAHRYGSVIADLGDLLDQLAVAAGDPAYAEAREGVGFAEGAGGESVCVAC
jgi:hypothetical protein